MSKPLASQLATVGMYYIGVSYDTFDCQAFVEQCLTLIGIRLDLKGSNAWYRKMTWRGSPEECKRTFGRIPAGAFLFILDQEGGGEVARGYTDGLGDATHIGIKTGIAGSGRGAIHSSSSRGGVYESAFADKTIRNGGWNRVGLWDALSYGEDVDAILAGKQQNEVIVTVPRKAWIQSDNRMGANLRSEKSAHSDRLAKIPEGTEVALVSSDGIWCEVIYNGTRGYVMSAYISAEEDTVTVSIERDAAQALYTALGDALGGGSASVG